MEAYIRLFIKFMKQIEKVNNRFFRSKAREIINENDNRNSNKRSR